VGQVEPLRFLVTGAAGFLGSRVVCQLLDRGHAVRALVRSASRTPPADWRGRAEVVQADLRTAPALENLFDGVDVLVHLAATMRASSDDPFASTTTGTERLLHAMRCAGSTRCIVLGGSCSVYDYSSRMRVLNEDSAVAAESGELDGYASAKIAQERITRRFAGENRWTLSVLRPGFVYGPGAGPAAVAGLALGRLFLVVAPTAQLRLTHVENCASAFVRAAEIRAAGTFNVIDDDRITAWRYAGRLRIRGRGFFRVPVPYHAGLAAARVAHAIHRVIEPLGGPRLPGILNPRQYQARFKPLDYDNRHAKRELAWDCRPFFETGGAIA